MPSKLNSFSRLSTRLISLYMKPKVEETDRLTEYFIGATYFRLLFKTYG